MSVQLTPQLVQAVRDAIDIVDIAGDLTSLQQNGKRHKGLCPFHKEKTPSFSVDPDAGLFYCFGCGVGGDAIKLHMQSSGDDFPAAIETLARRYGIPLPRSTSGGYREGPRRDVGDALEAAAEFFTHQLERSPGARSYLDEREISDALRQRYQLGYAPAGWSDLLDTLGRRIPVETLIAAGLVGRSQKTGKPYDRFRHRLIFPIHNHSGRLLGFGGRTLGEDRAKYINTAETERFHKGSLLYGLHQVKRTLRDGGRALLVEGYFDVLGAAASGLGWAVAGMGTALTPEQAKLLKRFVDEVVVAYDGDAAGEKAFRRALPVLLAEGLAVRRAPFPAGHDPDSLRLAEGPDAVAACVDQAADGVWLEIERLLPPPGESTPARQTRSAQEIVELLKPLRDAIMRRGYVRRAAEYLGVPEDLLLRRLGGQLYTRGVVPDGPSKARETPSAEEKALQILLGPRGALPLVEEMPPAEVFFDPVCRNIYAIFCDLYRRGDGRPPKREEVLARLSDEGSALDRVARLVLEESSSGSGSLKETFDRLRRRWQKQQLSQLMRQIRKAQERGDTPLLDRLLEEKAALSRTLHPDTTGRVY